MADANDQFFASQLPFLIGLVAAGATALAVGFAARWRAQRRCGAASGAAGLLLGAAVGALIGEAAAMFTPGQDGWVMSAWAAAVGAGALLLLPPRGWRSSAVLFALLGALAAALVLWPMIGPHRRFAAWSPALAESWPWFVALTVAPALIELALRRLGAGTLLVGIAVAAIGASALLAAGASARQGQFAAPVVAAVAGLLLLCRRLDARGLAGSAALVLGASLFAGHTYAEVAWLPALLVLAAPLLLLALCLLPWFASRPRWRLLTALLVVAVPVVAAVVIQRWPEPGSAGGSQIDYSHYYR